MSDTTPWNSPRTIVQKEPDSTDPKYGFEPNSRPLPLYLRLGVINLDKPPGPSSHEVVAWVKRLLGVKHAGHGGTLET